ncbi:MAG TPA: Hpt domain-containing protein [Burkholderiaceae bacterium]|nr:Hpt domain-containing protein [Burkholderiaceae bacterium]
MQNITIQTNENAPTAIVDKGSLTWVFEEVCKSLDVSIKSLKRHLEEVSRTKGAVLSAENTAHLRVAKQNLHQISGVIDVVGIREIKLLVDAMDATVQRYISKPQLCDESSVKVIERASFTVIEYLEYILASKAYSSLSLYSTYADIKALSSTERVHPTDLWDKKSFDWLDPKVPDAIQSYDFSDQTRIDLDRYLLSFMQTSNKEAATSLYQLCLGLSETQTHLKARTFWKLCASFFEAIANDKLEVDLNVKRIASGIVVHYNSMSHGEWLFSDKFMLHLLFFCEQAIIDEHDANKTPLLSIVKQVWGLKNDELNDYKINRYGHFDPAILAQARKRIVVAKELWTALSGGDLQKIRSTVEQFKLVTDSLLSLYPSSSPLANEILNTVASVANEKTQPKAELALELATAILYLEAVFGEWGTTDAEMQVKASALADRLESVRLGQKSKIVEPWIEELYRKVSDRESMGSIVGELRTCLSDVEKSIDLYFRSPFDQSSLHQVPNQLSQMRGIFSILGLEPATKAVQVMKEKVDEFLEPGFDFDKARGIGDIDKFGNNLGALGFLIDMLNYQPSIVKNLFIFNAETGDLNPLMGRAKTEIVAGTLLSTKAELTSKVDDVLKDSSLANKTQVAKEDWSKTSFLNTQSFESSLEDDHELKNIFFEEALDVISNGLKALENLSTNSNDGVSQANLRRVFHTLKGSARMVGLFDFGEAAWSFEQLLNARLSDLTPFDSQICKLSGSALLTFQKWVDDLIQNREEPQNASTLRKAAEAMLFENRLSLNGLLHYSNSQHAANTSNDIPSRVQFDSNPISDVKSPASEVLVTLPDKNGTPELIDIKNAEVASVGNIVDSTLTNEESGNDKISLSKVVEQMLEENTSDLTSTESEEQYKVIGDLKINIPLYNVYLNEADEWVRRLVSELNEWSLDFDHAIHHDIIGLSHALAGSSATVGFSALSNLAKSLELAMERTSHQRNRTAEIATLFNDAAEECHRLLHQFAAGFLKNPEPKLMKQLDGLDAVFRSVSHNTSPITNATTITDPKISLLSVQERKEELNVSHQKSIVDENSQIEYLMNKQELPLIPNSNSNLNHEALYKSSDTDIEFKDVLDLDLLSVFQEEVAELLPRLGAALRQWVNHPENLSARSEILRTLHTLKGSARLAGAMRLGELSHRMESAVEELGLENLQSKDIEKLQLRIDGLQSEFDGLYHYAELEDSNQIAIPGQIPEQKKPSVSPDSSRSLLTTAQIGIDPENVLQQRQIAAPAINVLSTDRKDSGYSIRVKARLLDRLVNQAGEVILSRSRIESELGTLRGSLGDLTGNLDKLRIQLRDIELQSETQMQSRMEQVKDSDKRFDPLEFDRFTRVQELTRMMAESVNDVATVQRSLQRTVEMTEDDLIAQARQTRDLQRDLLRTRMEEFESIADRLYRVVRQSSKDTNKQIKLDIVGGAIELDRGVLERMTPAFEHLLRNCVAHGIEPSEIRSNTGKNLTGAIEIKLQQDGNDVVIEFSDDGFGLDYEKIREKAISQNLIPNDSSISNSQITNLIFTPGFSTASDISELAGRGIGLDVVQAEVVALGGRIEVKSQQQKGTTFKLVLPLTTAVTQVVMLRAGSLSFGVPAHLVEIVRLAPNSEVKTAYQLGYWGDKADNLPFYWAGALLQASLSSEEYSQKTKSIIIFRSAGQRVALHVDEVFGNKEVVVKSLGSQLARLPGLAGMAILVSGAVALIYNPVALAAVYGADARRLVGNGVDKHVADEVDQRVTISAPGLEIQDTPLVLVVDDSITVRRIMQRLLQREGFRVVLAVDGLNAIEKLAGEIPAIVLSDIEMPHMDGFDLVRNIRSDARIKHIPIVMITSRIADKHKELAMSLGANEYLGKPYSEDGLLTILRKYTHKSLPAVKV